MYDSTLGRFLSRDPAGTAAGDANLYSYGRDAPTNLLDSTGQVATLGITQGEVTLGKYGQFNWPITWTVTPAPNIRGKGPTAIVGVIIQRLVIMYRVEDERGNFIRLLDKFSAKRGKPPFDYSGGAYLEAWKVQNDGKVLPLANFLGSTANDWYWYSGTLPKKTCGWLEYAGYATYYQGVEPWELAGRFGFKEGWAPGAGVLLSYGVPSGLLAGTDLWAQIKYVDERLTAFERDVQKRKIEPSESVEHSINVRWDMKQDDGQVVVASREPG